MTKAESSCSQLIFPCVREVSRLKTLLRELNFRKIATVIGLTLTLNCCLLSWSSLVNAEEAHLRSDQSWVNVKPKERRNSKKRGSLPVHRIGGGSRGNCMAHGGQLVALVPAHSVGLTTSTTPQLFFSVPETKETLQLELVVHNQQDELVYETLIATQERAGIIALKLPENWSQESLPTEENYHWYLSLICNRHNRSQDVVVSGWLKRIEIEPNIRQQLQAAAPLAQANLYQQQGIWHDALSAVLQAQKTAHQRDAARAKWTELLTALGLGELAHQPLIGELRLK